MCGLSPSQNANISTHLILHACLQFVFSFLFFLGPHLRHMEVPKLGLNWGCSCQPRPQPQQYWIWAASATYTTNHGHARSLTHWARRPGIQSTSSWILSRVLNMLSHNGNFSPCFSENSSWTLRLHWLDLGKRCHPSGLFPKGPGFPWLPFLKVASYLSWLRSSFICEGAFLTVACSISGSVVIWLLIFTDRLKA